MITWLRRDYVGIRFFFAPPAPAWAGNPSNLILEKLKEKKRANLFSSFIYLLWRETNFKCERNKFEGRREKEGETIELDLWSIVDLELKSKRGWKFSSIIFVFWWEFDSFYGWSMCLWAAWLMLYLLVIWVLVPLNWWILMQYT